MCIGSLPFRVLVLVLVLVFVGGRMIEVISSPVLLLDEREGRLPLASRSDFRDLKIPSKNVVAWCVKFNAAWEDWWRTSTYNISIWLFASSPALPD